MACSQEFENSVNCDATGATSCTSTHYAQDLSDSAGQEVTASGSSYAKCLLCSEQMAECRSCSQADRCSDCNDFYFVESGGRRCERCADNCMRCESKTKCTKCTGEYYLRYGRCLRYYYSTDRQYRLADGEVIDIGGGRTAIHGRIEYFYNGAWGTTCDDKSNDNTAKVFCRSVNLPYRNARKINKFGGGVGQILFGNVRC